MRKLIMILIFFGILILIFICYFFIGQVQPAKEIIWGINFSQKHAQLLNLDWKKTYSAFFEELKLKNLKLITHWDLIEPEKDNYHFEDLDWQIKKAEENKAKIILVIGLKTGRWPECHLPQWAKNLNERKRTKRENFKVN
jgi:hypothetical protein